MDFFTADEHIDHQNVLVHMQNRPWPSLEEMADEFVYRHNQVVRPQDRTIHLGDVAFKYASHAPYIRRLNGQHFLIKGNHERSRDVKKLQKDGPYEWIKDVYMLKGEQLFWLSHYPHLAWPQSHYGAIHLHGHCHGNLRYAIGKMMDVGVDANDFAPVSAEQVIQYMSSVDYYAPDHDRRRNGHMV